MKMGKKVREYKSGDFIFAKVKGYPAWPARVQGMNGKKYFVYFYGTGETANLPSSMIFDYVENKDKFLTKTVKRKDFNLGVKQIEYDFANNVPVEQVVGGLQLPEDTGLNDTANESTANNTVDDSTVGEADTTAVNDTSTEEKGRKSSAKVPSTPAKTPKEPKTPRGKARKEENKDDEEEKKEEKKEEEIISRSGRKIRPKRYIDDQIEDSGTLPSPAPKKRRGASPPVDKEKEPEKEKAKTDPPVAKEKIDKYKHFNAVTQVELEDLKEPFNQEEADKENILIAYMPNGQYVGIRLFQSRPTTFNNEASRLQWDKQAAMNAVTLKMQLERGQITAQSVIEQLVMDLQLSDEEKATLDKERETEEKKSRVQFLKTEMKLIELDAKIKTCLCLEKADTELCLKLLDELMDLRVKPLMLLKHPTCLETVKRMRAYVGNTPSWDLSESAALLFNKQAHLIRKQADTLYKNMKELFTTPEGLSFWEYFSERVLQFKKVTSKLSPDELLEMIHEPIEMSTPTSHTMKASVDAANEEEPLEEDNTTVKKNTPAKAKKTNGTAKTPLKRQSSRRQQQQEEVTTKDTNTDDVPEEATNEKEDSVKDTNIEENKDSEEPTENEAEVLQEPVENNEADKEVDSEEAIEPTEKVQSSNSKESEKSPKENDEEKAEEKTEEIKEKEKEKEKEKRDVDEPRAKRSRESKKTEPPQPRSPMKRKSKV